VMLPNVWINALRTTVMIILLHASERLTSRAHDRRREGGVEISAFRYAPLPYWYARYRLILACRQARAHCAIGASCTVILVTCGYGCARHAREPAETVCRPW